MLAVVVGGFLGPLVPAAGAESRLDVSAGYGGFHVPGRSLPVQVTVTAERLVKGELVVLGSGSSPRATLPVEVAGGSVKRFTLVVPGGVASSAGAVDVELRVGGRALGRGKAEVKAADDTELVGLGPQLAEGGEMPGPAPLAIDAGVARFAALDAGLLASAPTSLEPLSAVGLAGGELAQLAPGVRAALLRWVGGGGHLLLDEAPGTTMDGLPAEWQPGPAGRAAAGIGEVRLTGDAMSAGRWAGLIEPSSVGRDDDNNGFFSPESVADSLARDAGLRLPGLPWLLGFLGVYIAVVGPVTGFVLRWRRRPDLAWVVVPALAVAFTVLAYGAGNQLRPGAGLAHGTVLETRASGPVATSWVALTRRSAGTAQIALPGGWAISSSGSNNGNGFGPATPVLTVGNSGPEAHLPLASGEFGVFKAAGPVSVTGRLEVAASSASDGSAEGTVRNGLPFALDEVVVLVDGRRTRVGSLAPGEQKQWSAAGARSFDPSGSEAWMSEIGFRSDGLVNFSLWQSAQDDLGQDGDQTGTALAVGWTREWKPEFTVDGRSRRAPGRTAVVGRAPVTVAGGRVTDVAVSADVVRGPSLNPFRGKWIGNNAGEASVVKMTLPPGPAGRHLMVRTSLPLSDVAVWHNGAWHHLGAAAIRGNDLQAVLRFKRGIAINGRGFAIDAAPVPTTTTAPPMPMPMPQVPMTTMPMPFPMPPDVAPPMAAVPPPGDRARAGRHGRGGRRHRHSPARRDRRRRRRVPAVGGRRVDGHSGRRRPQPRGGGQVTTTTDSLEAVAPVGPPTPAVRTRGLTKRFGDLFAVDDLDLEVPRGSVFGLIGPNGAGKTTTFSILASLLAPTDGHVGVGGIDPVRDPRAVRRIIGYMPDVMGVYDNLRVSEYIEFFAAAYQVPRNRWPALIDGLLELVDLSDKRDAMVDSLSRGMKQRLSLARALVHDPDMLILDEPASGLDPRARIDLRGLLGGAGGHGEDRHHQLAHPRRARGDVLPRRNPRRRQGAGSGGARRHLC